MARCRNPSQDEHLGQGDGTTPMEVQEEFCRVHLESKGCRTRDEFI